MRGFICERVEHIVGKSTKCWLPAFPLFPAIRCKVFSVRDVDTQGFIVGSAVERRQNIQHFTR